MAPKGIFLMLCKYIKGKYVTYVAIRISLILLQANDMWNDLLTTQPKINSTKSLCTHLPYRMSPSLLKLVAIKGILSGCNIPALKLVVGEPLYRSTASSLMST